MTQRLRCLDRGTIRHLERDGLGWGHDLDCGCFEIAAARPTPGLRRFWDRLTGSAA